MVKIGAKKYVSFRRKQNLKESHQLLENIQMLNFYNEEIANLLGLIFLSFKLNNLFDKIQSLRVKIVFHSETVQIYQIIQIQTTLSIQQFY